jgi:hypothetical protein
MQALLNQMSFVQITRRVSNIQVTKPHECFLAGHSFCSHPAKPKRKMAGREENRREPHEEDVTFEDGTRAMFRYQQIDRLRDVALHDSLLVTYIINDGEENNDTPLLLEDIEAQVEKKGERQWTLLIPRHPILGHNYRLHLPVTCRDDARYYIMDVRRTESLADRYALMRRSLDDLDRAADPLNIADWIRYASERTMYKIVDAFEKELGVRPLVGGDPMVVAGANKKPAPDTADRREWLAERIGFAMDALKAKVLQMSEADPPVEATTRSLDVVLVFFCESFIDEAAVLKLKDTGIAGSEYRRRRSEGLHPRAAYQEACRKGSKSAKSAKSEGGTEP